MKHVDLSQYREGGIGLYSGNPRGAAVRKAAGLDRCDERGEQVSITIPDDVFAVTASFLSGLLAKSIRALGEEEFRRRYSVEGKGIDETLEAVIRYASKYKSAL